MVAISSIPNDLPVAFGSSDAATAVGNGSINGQAYFQKGEVSQGFRVSVWVWDLPSTTWDCFPISPIQGTGNPNGSVTPDAINQKFLDTATGNFYVATGTTSNDWLLTS